MPRPRKIFPPVAQAVLHSSDHGPVDFGVGSGDQRYAGIWQAQEVRLSTQLAKFGHAPLTHAETGRGCTQDATILRQDPAPLRKSRDGELEPQYFGLNRRYGLWFRQLRRLQALSPAMCKDATTPSAVAHMSRHLACLTFPSRWIRDRHWRADVPVFVDGSPFMQAVAC